MSRLSFITGWPFTLIAASAVGLLTFAPDWLGGIDGRYRPVVTPAILTSPKPMPPPAFRYTWGATSTKLRDCNYIRVEWFLGTPNGRSELVSSEFLGPPEIRGVGQLQWDKLAISLYPDDVLRGSFAYVFHKCPFTPWETRTLFYKSP